MALADAEADDLLAGEPALHSDLPALLNTLAALRGPSGLWWQVTDQPDLPGNYPESSSGAMFANAALVAARRGLMAAGMGLATLGALRADALHGTPPRLHGICEVAGLGGASGRDGTAAYYLSEPVVADDVKGSGPFLMAVAEAARAGHPLPAT